MLEIRINGTIIGEFDDKSYRAVINGTVYSAFEFLAFIESCKLSIYVGGVRFN